MEVRTGEDRGAVPGTGGGESEGGVAPPPQQIVGEKNIGPAGITQQINLRKREISPVGVMDQHPAEIAVGAQDGARIGKIERNDEFRPGDGVEQAPAQQGAPAVGNGKVFM